jgi:hypothetical protein
MGGQERDKNSPTSKKPVELTLLAAVGVASNLR